MNKKVVIKSNAADIKKFLETITGRRAKFKNGASTPLPKTYAVNETANKLHPNKQRLVIKDIIVHSDDVKSFILAPAGDAPLAYFRAGQYLSLSLKIGGALLTRPYSIASSPAEALAGIYNITVKRVPDGFVSGYILDNWIVGQEVTAYAPEGNFYYEPIRDAHTVVGIAGGSGITPFLSLAKSIADGTEDAELILLYGSRTEDDILFKPEFDALMEQCDKIKVVYVLSDSKTKGYEHGFIDKKLILKYAPEKFSVFVCGPGAMYNFVAKELETMDIPKKFIRFELFGETKNPAAIQGFPPEAVGKTFNCTVKCLDEEKVIPCSSEESVLVALERAGIAVPSRCRSGECGFCRSKLVSGEVFIPASTDGRRIADVKFGYIHPCCSYPTSDISIKIF
ncbi:MAG: 2Fe-2S iron-sulfur cluster binding domain-containing protein [Clostridiales bacterium]|nr:2Fe-2S iron-sulfur cluster binding domain-containing protein [Clostridiales bacterium]